MRYRDRFGNEMSNDTSQDKLLDFLYSNTLGRLGLRALSAPCISRIAGAFLDSYLSCFLIDPFIKKNQIRMKEYVPMKYKSYNEFFTRKIRKEARPIDRIPEHLITPCDGKVSVYPVDLKGKFKIKNSYYTVGSLLKNETLANEFEGGTVVIIRLSVDNYHRYCYVDDGQKDRNNFIPGRLYTVNPVILDHVNIYKENSRAYCELETKNFGKIIQVEVGALMVGKINNYHRVCEVKRGQEKGKFEFGGSTVVLLLQRDKVVIDADLVKNTEEGYETLVKMGERIGRKIGAGYFNENN